MTSTHWHRSSIILIQGIFGLLAVVAISAIMLMAADVVLVLFLGILLGIFVMYCGDAVHRWTRIPAAWASLLVITVMLGVLITSLAYFTIQIQNQIARASDQIQQGLKELQNLGEQYPAIASVASSIPLASMAMEYQDETNKQSRQPTADGQQQQEQQQSSEDEQSRSNDTGQMLGQIFRTTFGFVVNSVLIFFIAIFLAISPGQYREGLVRLVPPAKRRRFDQVLRQTADTLWHWLIGRSASMLISGTLAGITMALIGVPLPVTIGVTTAILTFIPNIGPVIAFVVAMLIALPQGMSTAIWVPPAFLAIEILESYILTPLIQQHQVSLPPVLLLAAQAVMSVLLGFLGAIVASPLLAVARVWVKELYVHDLLEQGSAQESLK